MPVENDPIAFRNSLSKLENDIAKEKRQRELELISQEHRLIASMVNLSRAIFSSDKEYRSEAIPRALGAFLWCLLLKPASTIGLIAVISLFISIWQTALIASQNKQLYIQNSLAEAQRYSTTASSLSDIYGLIASDQKENTRERFPCTSERKYSCWGEYGYVPSAVILGRIVTITHALKPYRSMKSNQVCWDGVFSSTRERIIQSISMMDKPAEATFADFASFSKFSNTNWQATLATDNKFNLREMLEFLQNKLSLGGPDEPGLSCRAISPERGQLLASLLAAQVSLKAIEEHGGTFRNAEIQGKLPKGVLVGDLSGAVFDNVDMSNQDFDSILVQGGDIRFFGCSRYPNPQRDKYAKLQGARLPIESFIEPNLECLMKSKGHALLGMHVHDLQSSHESSLLFSICTTLFLSRGAESWADELWRKAILVEVRPNSSGTFSQDGIFMDKAFDKSGLILEGKDDLGAFKITYHNLDDCGKLDGLIYD